MSQPMPVPVQAVVDSLVRPAVELAVSAVGPNPDSVVAAASALLTVAQEALYVTVLRDHEGPARLWGASKEMELRAEMLHAIGARFDRAVDLLRQHDARLQWSSPEEEAAARAAMHAKLGEPYER